MAAALAGILNRTRIGGAIQAVAADRDAAQLVGVDLAHTYALTFAVGAACAGVAGGLISMIQSITPGSSGQYTLASFVVVVLGGLGRVSATVVGGLVFGLVEIPGAEQLAYRGRLLQCHRVRPDGAGGHHPPTGNHGPAEWDGARCLTVP